MSTNIPGAVTKTWAWKMKHNQWPERTKTWWWMTNLHNSRSSKTRTRGVPKAMRGLSYWACQQCTTNLHAYTHCPKRTPALHVVCMKIVTESWKSLGLSQSLVTDKLPDMRPTQIRWGRKQEPRNPDFRKWEAERERPSFLRGSTDSSLLDGVSRHQGSVMETQFKGDTSRLQHSRWSRPDVAILQNTKCLKKFRWTIEVWYASTFTDEPTWYPQGEITKRSTGRFLSEGQSCTGIIKDNEYSH